MPLDIREVVETLSMVSIDLFDIRTVTMGISLRDCFDSDVAAAERKIVRKLRSRAGRLVETVDAVSRQYDIPVANKRIAITPLSLFLDALPAGSAVRLARAVDRCAVELGVDFVGGATALVHKAAGVGDRRLMEAYPEIMTATSRLCGSVNVGSTLSGINMDAVFDLGRIIKRIADATASSGGSGCARFVVFCNAREDNPFMAGAFHGVGEADCCISVGVSGPGVVRRAVELVPHASFDELAEVIKRIAFKITRVGQLMQDEVSKRLGVPRGIVDISLAPTPAEGDSVAAVLEAMGLEVCGTHGTTAALAFLNEAVKRGGLMAATHVGGLSGAFIPVSEDAGMISAALSGVLTLDKLEAMTCVCSVGLDMVCVPGDTPAETISGIIADECAIGLINDKTTAVRIIPVPGAKPGDKVPFGGLLGDGVVQEVHPQSCARFVSRGGRFPAPVRALTN